ncbi:MAG: MopE-related protein, partial [Bacteroidota bacterium]
MTTELCNGIDDNCDGLVDGSNLIYTTYYKDADADGFGLLNDDSVSCDQPVGYVAVAGDCNDANASINPSISEQCNAIDDDCDGMIDDGLQFIT